MTETERIKSLFEKLYNGDPWIGVSIVSTLSKLSGDQAAKRPLATCNTIWEIVNHMVSWRLNVSRRVQGELMTTPQSNYVEPISDASEAAWKKSLSNFETTQKQWLALLTDFPVSDFEKVYPPNQMNYYEHIQGMLQHDAYHLGQIVLLSKLV
jgi:uncharacterized damage-inducible protein DinB